MNNGAQEHNTLGEAQQMSELHGNTEMVAVVPFLWLLEKTAGDQPQ